MDFINLSRIKIHQVNGARRLCAAGEVGLFMVFVLIMLWSVPTMVQPLRFYCTIAVLTWIFGLTAMSHLAYGETLEELGFGLKWFRQAVSELALPVCAVMLILIAIGLGLGTLEFGRKFFLQLVGIPFWALFQQYAAQSFINRRLQIAVGKGRWSAVLTAIIFSSVHLPNPALALATAAAGYVWARVYQNSPNLYAIALSHGLLSAIFVNVMPKTILPNMVVGYNYLVK